MNAKITRRQALLATAGIAAGTLATAQDKKPADKSWVGLTVLPRSGLVVGRDTLDEGGGTHHRLTDASYSVKAENGTKAKVLSGVTGVWVEKQEMVPLADAVAFYDGLIKANPRDLDAHNFRAWALRLLGKREDAVKGFTDFLALNPYPAYGLSNRGLTYAELGKFDEAFKDLEAGAASGREGWVMAVANTGYAHELRGDFDKAIAEYKKAVTQGSVLAKNNLAWVRATCPNEKLRDWAEAVKLAKDICDATGNEEGMYLDTLAAAYAETGKFDEAVKAQELAHKDKSYDLAYGDEGRARLKLYKQKKPFRTEPPRK